MGCRAVILLACFFAGALGRASVVRRALPLSRDSVPAFDVFVENHGRELKVGSAEYEHRRAIYLGRIEMIREHNANPARLWTAGVNHMSDRTDAEFRERLGWRHHHEQRSSSLGASLLELGNERTTPFRVVDKDYMNLSVASDVRDQGGCGSCWAMASAELLKAHDEIRNGHARDFSVQELVSCVKNTKKCGGAGGCDGATVELAMDYVMNNGLRSTQDVPYLGVTGECDKNAIDSRLSEIDTDGRVLFTVGANAAPGHLAPKDVFIGSGNGAERAGQALGLKGFYTIEKNKYEPLMRALIEVGPVAITVAASDWMSYASGVFSNCVDPTLNHAVLLMGVGKEGQHNTYIIKNSWGSRWGENGYIRLLRTHNEESNCAEDHSPLEGVACEGGPAKVEVCGMCGILYDNVVATFRKTP